MINKKSIQKKYLKLEIYATFYIFSSNAKNLTQFQIVFVIQEIYCLTKQAIS